MRIACVLSEGFEDSEFRKPYDALTGAGHEVVVIAAEAGASLAGKAGNEQVMPDLTIDQARPADFGALFIPGGYSPDHLRADPRFVEFTKAFFADDRPVLTICHGPQLLITAGVTQGRRMTAWRTIQADLRGFGTDVVDEEVVVDGNLVTSRQPSDIEAFNRESLRVLERIPAGRS